MRNEIARPPIFSGGKPKFFLISIFFLVFSFFFSPLTTHHSPFTNEVYAALSCDSCHKGPPYGPNYTSVPADKKYNSHIKHTTAPFNYGCQVCHVQVTTGAATATAYTIAFATNHTNGDYNVNPGTGVSFSYTAGYTVGQSTCSTISCHGNNKAFWGGTVSCYDCHVSTTDVDDYTFKNNITAMISTHSVVGWFGTGHGRITGNYESGRPPANFEEYCEYCHSTDTAHGITTNPFRLANTGTALYNAYGDPKNGNCLVCHSTVTAGGYNPPGPAPAKNATVTRSTFTFHVISGVQGVEGSNTDGGRYCWDCHDPHGDWSLVYPSTLAYMIQARPVELTAGTTQAGNTYGVPFSLVTVSSFTKAMGNATVYDYFDYVVASSSGICQTCHDTTVSYFNKGSYLTSHNPGAQCTSCHEHKNYFIGKGECISCHDGVAGSRRAIKGEFNQTWTHMRSSTPTAKTVKNEDCAICHMEGDSAGKTTSYHKEGATSTPVGNFAGMIQLRNPDTNATILFSTWSGRIAGIAGSSWTTPGANYKDWPTETRTGYLYKVVSGSFSFVRFERKTSTNVLEAWVTSVQNNLCLRCHDETGGAKVDPGDPTRPFSSSTGVVVNVSSHFATTNASYHPIKGPQNNSFADKETMGAPWNAVSKVTGTTTGWGQLISCWDCHIATHTAHGGNITLRATYNLDLGKRTELCVLCHNATVYWGAARLDQSNKTAFDSYITVDYGHSAGDNVRHEPTEGGWYGCASCHGSAYTLPDRQTRAANAHGFNLRLTNDNWPSGARPFSFIRFTGCNIDDWRPRVSGAGSFTNGMCGTSSNVDHCGVGNADGSYLYQPGGSY